jgi:FtsP/CotA-like multicopper oxidase with cupredoxin domain
MTKITARAQVPVFVVPGNRIDLLVKAPAGLKPPASAAVMVVRGVSVSAAQAATPNVPLLNIRIAGSGPVMPLLDQPGMPPRPEFLKDIQSSEIVGDQRKLTFSTDNVGGPSEHTINGQKFGEGRPWKVDKLNVAEEWKIINTTDPKNGAIDHPFHIHINPFQVTAVFDPNQPLLNADHEPVKDKDGNVLGVYVFSTTQPPPGSLLPGQCWVNPNDEKTWIPCPPPNPQDQAKTNIWWDVFPIPGAREDTTTKILVPGYFVLRSRFVDYRGAYVMHCHILAHEDRGMMMTVEVATDEPVPHHH